MQASPIRDTIAKIAAEDVDVDLCDICDAPMKHLTGPATWQDTTECTACGWSPDDAWKVG